MTSKSTDEIRERIVAIRRGLREDAEQISRRYGGAPVSIIVAGSAHAQVPGCITVFANVGEGREGRLRDQLGILQTAIQIVSLEHFQPRKAARQEDGQGEAGDGME